jgi:hypothetical protein
MAMTESQRRFATVDVNLKMIGVHMSLSAVVALNTFSKGNCWLENHKCCPENTKEAFGILRDPTGEIRSRVGIVKL